MSEKKMGTADRENKKEGGKMTAGAVGNKKGGDMAPETNTEKNMVDQVNERVEQEEAQFGEAAEQEGPQEITSAFIKQCLYENERGDGMLFSVVHAGRFLYANVLKEWLVFRDHHLEIDVMEEALIAVEDVATIYKQEAIKTATKKNKAKKEELSDAVVEALDEEKKGFNKRVNRLYADRGRTNCLKFARTIKTPLAIRGDEIDQKPYLLAVKNGVIDLKTGELRPGQLNDYLMKASPVEFKGIDAPCPEWEKFLSNVFENQKAKSRPEIVNFIQRLMGYVLIGNVSEHIFVMLAGEGRNGKGTIMTLIEHILGSLAGTVQSEMLLGQKVERSSAAVSPDIMNLRGLRLANASETDDGRRFSSSKVKWLSGGDTLQGRWPYDKRMTDFAPTHTLFLQTNHPPHAQSSDKPFWERLVYIEFLWSYVKNPKKTNERKRDITLKDRLIAEASGILGWLVKGCLIYQEDGLAIPDEVIEAGKRYKKSEDDMGEWIDDKCVLDEDYHSGATELFDNFKEWYAANVSKSYQWSQRKFGIELMKSLPDLHKYKEDGVTKYRGIGLR
jgi:putative DNA primase/helicase